MSIPTQFNIKKDQIIDTLINNQCYKMPDGRQFYEATEQELLKLISSYSTNNHEFCIG